MKALDNAIKEIKKLPPDELMRVYDMIVMLKNRRERVRPQSKQTMGRSRVLNALKTCRSDFGSDIIDSRGDRL